MKVTLYELLGLVKDKKAPKKVLISDKVYYLLEKEDIYVYSRNDHDIRDWESFIDHSINITRCLNNEILILENNDVEIEEEKEIDDTNVNDIDFSEYKKEIDEINKSVYKLKKNKRLMRKIKEGGIMKTIYGHCIFKEKEEDFVLFKDYQQLLKIIEKQQESMEDTINFIKCLYTGGYISEMTQNNIIERIEKGYKFD